MNKFFKDILSPDDWLIYENGFNPSKLNIYETIFTLGNGYMGSRGILEEVPYDSMPGTYIAGVQDKSLAQVTEIVNVPNPVDLRISAEGEKIDIKGMYVREHERILDMKHGILFRHSVLANSRKERFDYKSLRFISSHDKHVGVMKIWVTPLDAPNLLTVQDSIDVSVRNRGVLTEGRKKHFQISEVRSEKGTNYICARTQDTRISIGCATHLTVSRKGREYAAPDQSFDIKLEKGEELVLTKIFYMRTSRHLSKRRLRDTTLKSLKKNMKRGFEGLLLRHTKAFETLWKRASILITGDSDAQRSLRFNIYHMLIAGNPYDKDVSVGAKTLSGEGYRGHVFWDTEIYLLPFYIYNFPKIARNILMYRYNRLDAARRRAAARGFKGALFPWESADTGEDETPQWHKDLDGSIIPISTQEYEHHIVADIAYGVDHYYTATADQKFLNTYGSEIIFETARFWASRVKKNKKKKRFEILNVMGPDEFHANIDNNAYTNAMARWNLRAARRLYCDLKENYKKSFSSLARKIKLSEKEVRRWREIAEGMYIPMSKDKKLIESYQGYFKQRDIVITRLDKHFMPEFPPNLPLSKLQGSQILKQLDAVMLIYLLPHLFDKETAKKTIDYYEKRTVHKSSLSTPINAIMCLEAGNATRAYQYFLFALNADLKAKQSNTADGIHAGSLGGCWQAAVNGFGGMRIRNRNLSFSPQLPAYWQDMRFHIRWRGDLIFIDISQDSFNLHLRASRNKRPLEVEVYGRLYKVLPGESIKVGK